MNCAKCEWSKVCCSPDAWEIPLTAEEALELNHVRTSDGRMFISANTDGSCFYQDSITGKCNIYDKRPQVCRAFSCDERKSEMAGLLKKHEENREYINSKYSGYFVAFIFSTSRFRSSSDLIIRDPETGKEIKLTPQRVCGQTEDDVKRKMVDILSQPFNKEDI
jgi:Fe-S-cluster containining protein